MLLSEAGEVAGGWLPRETLESLLELNELSLGLLAEQAAARGPQPGLLLRQFAELWRVMDGAARRRAADCPYLLVDAGFADPLRWRQAPPPGVGDGAPAGYTSFFSVPGATQLARLVFTYAWHLAISQSAAARLLLGMSAPCAQLISQYNVREIHALAEAHTQWLRPRWPARVCVWRELLLAAAAGDAAELARARLHGLTLLAAAVRGAQPQREPPGGDAGAIPRPGLRGIE
jgi:hypothetical protein